jgi:FixJ family two-component response regulator
MSISSNEADVTDWIAVVDDDVSFRQAIGSLLESYTLRARTFDTAEAFLQALVGSLPSCAIFDMHMPDRTGLELLQYLRANGFKIPAIVMTASANPRLRKDCEAAGASAFLTKPIDTNLLLAAVELATNNAGASNPFPPQL